MNNTSILSVMKYAIFLLLISISFKIYSQESNPFVKFNGTISLSYENYSFSEENYSSFRARYPGSLFRFSANTTFQIGEYLSIPMGIDFSNQETTYNLPSLPEEGFFNYIQNPRNNIHINPTYKWINGKLGSHTPMYSELTTGDIQIFGIGFDINPGKFIFSMSYGKSQHAIEPDLLLNIPGAYKQNLLTTRIGYGKINGSKVTLNLVKIKDDVNSVIEEPLGFKPKEGISISPYVELKITKNLRLKTETALSIFTENLTADADLIDDGIINGLNSFMSINNSSVMDYSHLTNLQWTTDNVTLGGEVKYIGPGFMPVGYRNIENDIIDYKLISGFKLLKRKLIINAIIGQRTNNIKETKLNRNKRFIGNLNLLAQLSEKFTLNTTYSNFGFRNNAIDDALRIEMVNNSFSITPTYQIRSKKAFQQASITASFDQFNQYDVFSDADINTTNNSYNANYLISFIKSPLNLGVNFMYLQNKSEISDLNLTNYSVNLGYKFLEKKLSTSMFITLMNMKRTEFTADNRLNIRAKFNYKINKGFTINMNYNLNNNKYGSYRPDAITREHKIQISIIKKI